MKFVCLSVLFVGLLASCASPGAGSRKPSSTASVRQVSLNTAKVAAKPVSTTLNVAYDSVVIVNALINNIMGKLNTALPSSVR